MNTILRKLTVSALAGSAIAAVALVPVIANAATVKSGMPGDQVVTASKSGAANPDFRLSEDGYNAIRDIRAARVAIFNGAEDQAREFITQASADLQKVKADDMVVSKKQPDNVNPNLVPVDGQLFVVDNFTSSKEKQAHIAASNAKIKQGKVDEAIKDLKLADVDVGFTRVLMPLAATEHHIKVASDLFDGGHYYEANMALKAAEDALQVDTVMLVQTPKDQTAQAASASATKAQTAQAQTAKPQAATDTTTTGSTTK